MEPTVTAHKASSWTPPPFLTRATELQSLGRVPEATAELEQALAGLRESPYDTEFMTRLQTGLLLADLHLASGAVQTARDLLTEEVAWAEKVVQIMQITGGAEHKRMALNGQAQLRDRATQVGLIGQPAPEIAVETWVQGRPTTLAELRGRVVLLEFWATWCASCPKMFPKLRQLHESFGERGLEIIASTRHYSAIGGTPQAKADELDVIRKYLDGRGLEFAIGLAPDEGTQQLYGAVGLPTMALIDRAGLVRSIQGGDGSDVADAVERRRTPEPARRIASRGDYRSTQTPHQAAVDVLNR